MGKKQQTIKIQPGETLCPMGPHCRVHRGGNRNVQGGGKGCGTTSTAGGKVGSWAACGSGMRLRNMSMLRTALAEPVRVVDSEPT